MDRIITSVKRFGACAVLAMAASTSAQAILITQNSSAADLANAVAAQSGGTLSIVNSPVLSGNPGSSGTYTNASGTYGIGNGIVLSSGNVNNYNDGPNTLSNTTTNFGVSATAGQELLLDPITGGSFDHFDVTQLDLDFTTTTGSVFFNVVFGSEEFPEFVGSTFIDGFGLYLDGINIAFFGGGPVNINHPGFAAVAGTELDGVLLDSGGPVTFSSTGLTIGDIHKLTFIIADTSDSRFDSTAYIGGLSGVQPPDPTIPEPTSIALLGLGLLGLPNLRRKLKFRPG